MKRFLRFKLVPTFTALLMLSSSVIAALSGSILHSHAATPTVQASGINITSYSLPTGNSLPGSITTGPDGNLWFTEVGVNKIGKITTGGVITEYPIPTSNSFPRGMASGADGNLWFIEIGGNQVGKITPGGTIAEYPIPTNNSVPEEITSGPDGNLWFTELFGNNIGKITTGGVVTEYPIPTSVSQPKGITAGPDGNLWFTESSVNEIGKITPSGTITQFPLPSGGSDPEEITSGPDGNLWFTEYAGSKIGKITTSGTITEYAIPIIHGLLPAAVAITAGPDHNIWFGLAGKIAKITTTGTITEYPLPNGTNTAGMTAGPDGNLWFTESGGNAIGRINFSHQKLFVLLQGINTGLSNKEANTRNNFGKVDDFWKTVNNVPGIVPFLQMDTNFQTDYPHASFLVYSYGGSNTDGTPLPYSCADTLKNVVLQDAINLDIQIKNAVNNNPILQGKPTDIYLIGHSLGGVVALTYLAALITNLGTDHQFSLPLGASLKGVVSLDSPLGGIPSAIGLGPYLDLAHFYFVTLQHCPGLTDNDFLSPYDLASIYDSASKTPPSDDGIPYPRGAQASVLGTLQRFDLSNEQIAEQAHTTRGTSFLAIGNTIDLTWNANQCVPSIPDFSDTQFLEDEGSSTGIYGREFTAGNAACFPGAYNLGNHKEVFHNTDVENGLLNFLIPTIGGTPDPLSPAPGSD